MTHLRLGANFWNQWTDWPTGRRCWKPALKLIVRGMLDATEPSAAGPRYRARQTRNLPLPIQHHLPLLIGGSGERVTLRLVARYADMNNVGGRIEAIRVKERILHEHCAAIGRNASEIERTASVGTIFIRDDRAEADRICLATFENNRAGPWYPHVGTPEDIAVELCAVSRTRIPTPHRDLPGTPTTGSR